MGKAAILIIAASIAMGSMYSLAAKDDARQAEKRLSTHQYEVLARNAALAGYNRAKQALADDFDAAPAELTGSYAGNDYDVTVTKNGNVARVQATGVSMTADGTEVDFTIDSAIEKELISEIADDAPAFMRYALITDDDLELNGNILLDLLVDGDESNTLNANMHTNGRLHINGNAATIRGFGTFVQGATATPSSALESTFAPYYNPGNDPVSAQVSTVEIPTFDISTMLSTVSVDRTTSGLLPLTGTYDLGGTREDPYVWHVTGSLENLGGVHINGYAIFIVEGDVTLSGDFEGAQSDYDGGDESHVAVYSAGTVTIDGNSDLHGQIYAGGGVVLSGTPSVYGSITTKGPVTLSGTPNIYYRKASPALTTMFEEPEVHYNLISYMEG